MITVLTTLGGVIWRIRALSVAGNLQAVYREQARELARSGLRYAKLDDYSPHTAYTLVRENDGRLHRYPAAWLPEKVTPAGVIIEETGCGRTALGVVAGGSALEARFREAKIWSHGLPCWFFSAPPDGNGAVYDSCGENAVYLHGASWTACAGDAEGVLALDGTGDYAVSAFRPACELPEGSDFTAVARVRTPDHTDAGAVFGVQQPGNNFRIDISDGNFRYRVGTSAGTLFHTVVNDRWYQLILSVSGSNIVFRADWCGSGGGASISGTLSAPLAFPRPDDDYRLYIGAVNRGNAAPVQFFKGDIDYLRFYGTELSPGDLPPLCPGGDTAADFRLDAASPPASSTGSWSAAYSAPAPPLAAGAFCPDAARRFDGAVYGMTAAAGPGDTLRDYPVTLLVRFRTTLSGGTDRPLASLTSLVNPDQRHGLLFTPASGGRICMETAGNTTLRNIECDTVNAADDGVWHLAAAVWAGPSDRRLYLDGSPAPTAPLDTAPDAVSFAQPADSMEAGYRSGSSPAYFRGDMDLIQRYDAELTDTEIQALAGDYLP